MGDDTENLSKLGIEASKIGQVNINPQNVEQKVNISVFFEQLPSVPPSDTDEMNRIMANHKIEQLRSRIMDSSHELIIKLAEAIQLAQQMAKKSIEEEFLFTLGLIYFAIGNYKESINFYNQAFNVQNFGNNFGKNVINICCIGSSLLLSGNIDEAFEKYQETIRMMESEQAKSIK